MKVVNADEMRELDRLAMTDFSIPGTMLMENAGIAIVDFMRQCYVDLRGKSVVILCGKGNNGGDGYVVARHLALLGMRVSVYALEVPGVGTLAHTPYDTLCKTNPSILFSPNLSDMRCALEACDFVIDAMLGTGLNRAPQSPYKEVLETCEGLPANVQRIAVDIPSGLDTTTGQIYGAVFRAHHTVTFGYPKWGFYIGDGADVAGEIHIVAIGFPWEAIPLQIASQLSTPSDMKSVLEAIRFSGADAHKGNFGHVGIIAGSRGMVGAPALSAMAAQRSGAGLVTVFAPKSAQAILATKLNEQMTVPLEEEEGCASESAFDTIVRYAERMTVLCIGPGLTTHPSTVRLVQRILLEIPKPVVLDADGLNALAKSPTIAVERAKKSGSPLILTPHPGEASRLLGTQTDGVQSNRLASVQSLAKNYCATVLLKGKHTLIANPMGAVVVNSTGNGGMATGGSGDTLTGIIGSLLAQSVCYGNSVNVTRTVALGAFLHGLAGDLAVEEIDPASLVASDIINHISKAIRHIKGSV